MNPTPTRLAVGHSDIRTTYNRYGHLMPRGEAAAADRLSAFLGGSERVVAVQERIA